MFYNINTELAYLSVEVGMTVIYTLLVTGRLLRSRRQMENFVAKEHLHTLDKVATMIVESAAPYSILGIIFIISFALHSNISNLVFLSISHVQASFKSLPQTVAQIFVSYLGHFATFYHHPCCSGKCRRFPEIFRRDPSSNPGVFCWKIGRRLPISGLTSDRDHCGGFINIVEAK